MQVGSLSSTNDIFRRDSMDSRSEQLGPSSKISTSQLGEEQEERQTVSTTQTRREKEEKTGEQESVSSGCNIPKRRGEICIRRVKDIRDPSDPENKAKWKTVELPAIHIPMPEFGLGGGFEGVF